MRCDVYIRTMSPTPSTEFSVDSVLSTNEHVCVTTHIHRKTFLKCDYWLHIISLLNECIRSLNRRVCRLRCTNFWLSIPEDTLWLWWWFTKQVFRAGRWCVCVGLLAHQHTQARIHIGRLLSSDSVFIVMWASSVLSELPVGIGTGGLHSTK